MSLPDLRAWLFSAKTFAAAMLALYVAMLLDLPRPYWALATCYIVAQPSSGMARAKGLYRLLGTLAGGIGAIVIVPNLVNAPPLLSLAMAAWTGLCLAASLLLRAPHSYAFMLAGYTAAIIGFPTLDDPGTIFPTAVARATEIGLGIVCVLAVDCLLPEPTAPAAVARLDALLRDVLRAGQNVVTGASAERFAADQRLLARERAVLEGLISHLRYEGLAGDPVRDWAPVLHQRLRIMPLLLAGIIDRREALLAADPAAAARVHPALRAVSDWIGRAADACAAGSPQDTELLLARLRAAEAPGDTAEDASNWPGLLRASLLLRLRELVETINEGVMIRQRMARGESASRAERRAAAIWPAGHTDHLLIALSAVSAALAVWLCCVFWIGAGWADGASAAMMAAVGTSMFATMDDPAPVLGQFIGGTVVAILLAAVYVFGVFPRIDGYVLLAASLAVVFLPLGAAQGMPAWMPLAMPVTVTGATLLGLAESYSADFAAFANGAVATLLGLWLSLVVTRVLRSVGVAWRVRRLAQADRRDLVRAVRGDRIGRDGLVAAMLDRFDAFAARLGPANAPISRSFLLMELRVALNVMELQALRPALDRRLGLRVDRVLRRVARHFDAEAEGDTAMLRAAIDTTLDSATHGARGVALALVGLRRAILPDAAPPQGAPLLPTIAREQAA